MRIFSALEQLWPVASSPTLGAKPTSGKENKLNGGRNSSKTNSKTPEESGPLQTRSGSQTHHFLQLGDSSSSPLHIGSRVLDLGGTRRSQATKHISTQPLCVPTAAENRVLRPASNKHLNNDEDKLECQPNVSSEHVVERIRTLLQPTTPVIREVGSINYRYYCMQIATPGLLMMGYSDR